jgi:hypothetical protein
LGRVEDRRVELPERTRRDVMLLAALADHDAEVSAAPLPGDWVAPGAQDLLIDAAKEFDARVSADRWLSTPRRPSPN